MSLSSGPGLLGGLSSWRMLVGLRLSCRRLLGARGLLGRLNIWWIRMIRFRMGFNFEIMPALVRTPGHVPLVPWLTMDPAPQVAASVNGGPPKSFTFYTGARGLVD